MEKPTIIKLDYSLGTVRSRASIIANIAKIDALIDSLFTTATQSVTNGHRVEYELDTGQTKTNVVYSDMKSVTDAIKNYEELRETYMNYLRARATRQVRLVDSKNFRG